MTQDTIEYPSGAVTTNPHGRQVDTQLHEPTPVRHDDGSGHPFAHLGAEQPLTVPAWLFYGLVGATLTALCAVAGFVCARFSH